MARPRGVAAVVLVAGAVVTLAGLLADVIGIGRTPGFQWQQQAATVVGLLTLGAGWWLTRR